MLYFSKLRIIFITLLSSFFILLASSNLFNFENNFLNKKINLGLDLQGGSYLLLEIDNNPVIEQKLQNLTLTLRNYFKEKNIKLNNIDLSDQVLSFTVKNEDKKKVIEIFEDEKSEINPYYPRFKSHELKINDENDILRISYSKQGLIELKTSSQDQA